MTTSATSRDAACQQFGSCKPDESWDTFAARLSFGAASPDDPSALVAAVAAAEKAISGGSDHRRNGDSGHIGRLFHLAVPPVAFGSVVQMLGASGLATENARVIIEKPFGTDLASAVKLNETVHAVFDESRVFRIDHFLGKESVDNVLAFRFANGLFEPIWNRNHIKYVQIDVPETLTVEQRAAFYDATGAYRDMVVTHLFQVLGFVAMEPPTSLNAKPLRDEKSKVYDALRPDRRAARGARAVRRVPGHRRRAQGLGHRDDDRAAGRGGELALARRAVLPALRQGARAVPSGRHAGVPHAACADVPHPQARRAGRPDATRSSSTSPIPGRSASSSWPRCPGLR